MTFSNSTQTAPSSPPSPHPTSTAPTASPSTPPETPGSPTSADPRSSNSSPTEPEAAASPYTVQSGGVDLAIDQKAVWETDLLQPRLRQPHRPHLPRGPEHLHRRLECGCRPRRRQQCLGRHHRQRLHHEVFGRRRSTLPHKRLYRRRLDPPPEHRHRRSRQRLRRNLPSAQPPRARYSSTRTPVPCSRPAPASPPPASCPTCPSPPGGIAVDGSGNVWVTGTDNQTSFPDYVTEIIGLAAPVVTPPLRRHHQQHPGHPPLARAREAPFFICHPERSEAGTRRCPHPPPLDLHPGTCDRTPEPRPVLFIRWVRSW